MQLYNKKLNCIISKIKQKISNEFKIKLINTLKILKIN